MKGELVDTPEARQSMAESLARFLNVHATHARWAIDAALDGRCAFCDVPRERDQVDAASILGGGSLSPAAWAKAALCPACAASTIRSCREKLADLFVKGARG